ncbi:SDR family NAD(P)-dependent oxidoreductase [Anaeromicropila herbilytica]|uniref:Short-chain dehydrogenase n=1 Tax=Anaeromicropila herbilytica TaxID=2785025 RepID=A0A7R7IAX1_9FIRM|nr:SDR family oxidoreductase [Anaeromicropila herbilytica]BCN28897.1 short-chain dehydrogenase [Anaeromicropila herbilytica]
MNAKGKNIVVTGGGNGVGRELVLQLLQKGATVFAADINEEALKETVKKAKNNSRLFIYVVDISDLEAVFDFARKVIEEHGKVDGVINNAGIIQPFIHLNELEMDRIDRVMNINFYGTLYMVKAFLPYLLKRPEAHIVNVSSMGGYLPVPGQSIYGASKAAVKILTEGLSSELKNTNVDVSVVIPGGIATDIKKNSNIEYKVTSESKKADMLLTPQKAAELIIRAMEKKKLRTYIGKDCKVMNFLYRMNSRLAMNMINKVMSSSEH